MIKKSFFFARGERVLQTPWVGALSRRPFFWRSLQFDTCLNRRGAASEQYFSEAMLVLRGVSFGQCVTNPSGGLLSKGHPLGATGLAQCYELVNQLRGNAGNRQVPGVKLGLQHNLGLGGACVVTLYESSS